MTKGKNFGGIAGAILHRIIRILDHPETNREALKGLQQKSDRSLGPSVGFLGLP